MNFNLKEAIEVLARTPQTLEACLSGLSDEWLQVNEGEGTWTVTEVLEHLIEGEKTNWIPRLNFLIQEGAGRPFPPFDRYAHLQAKEERSMARLLPEFKSMRTRNVAMLNSLVETEAQLELEGTHPEFGAVKARELIATWVVHDLTHIAQIVRVMAGRYRTDVGPWIEYLGILKRN